MSPDRGNEGSFKDLVSMYACSVEEVEGGNRDVVVGVVVVVVILVVFGIVFVCDRNQLSIHRTCG